MKGGGYMVQLDGLRAFAVLLVILFHTQSDWVPGGYIGVDVFFVLSGFLITGILAREYDRTGRIALGNFYVRRALRLLPALLFMAVVLSAAYLILLSPQKRDASLMAVLAAVAYLTSPLAAAGADLGSMLHAWSLSVEEYFYIGWPIGLILAIRWAGRSRALGVVLALTLMAVGYRLLTAFIGWPLERIYYAVDTRAEQLLIGCLLALVMIRYRFRPGAWVVVAAVAFLLAFAVVPATITAPFYRFGGSTVVATAAGLIIAGLVSRPGVGLARALSLAPLVWVGKRSYGIYLWHAPLAAMIAFALPSWVPLLPVDLILTLIVAMLSYRFIEQPMLRLKTRFGGPPARTPVSTHAAPSINEGPTGVTT